MGIRNQYLPQSDIDNSHTLVLDALMCWQLRSLHHNQNHCVVKTSRVQIDPRRGSDDSTAVLPASRCLHMLPRDRLRYRRHHQQKGNGSMASFDVFMCFPVSTSDLCWGCSRSLAGHGAALNRHASCLMRASSQDCRRLIAQQTTNTWYVAPVSMMYWFSTTMVMGKSLTHGTIPLSLLLPSHCSSPGSNFQVVVPCHTLPNFQFRLF